MTSVEVRDKRLYDPQKGGCFGPEFRDDHEGKQFLEFVRSRQLKCELTGRLGLGHGVETWDNDDLNNVFRDFYWQFVDRHGMPARIPIRRRSDGNYVAGQEKSVLPLQKPTPRWIAWLQRKK